MENEKGTKIYTLVKEEHKNDLEALNKASEKLNDLIRLYEKEKIDFSQVSEKCIELICALSKLSNYSKNIIGKNSSALAMPTHEIQFLGFYCEKNQEQENSVKQIFKSQLEKNTTFDKDEKFKPLQEFIGRLSGPLENFIKNKFDLGQQIRELEKTKNDLEEHSKLILKNIEISDTIERSKKLLSSVELNCKNNNLFLKLVENQNNNEEQINNHLLDMNKNFLLSFSSQCQSITNNIKLKANEGFQKEFKKIIPDKKQIEELDKILDQKKFVEFDENIKQLTQNIQKLMPEEKSISIEKNKEKYNEIISFNPNKGLLAKFGNQDNSQKIKQTIENNQNKIIKKIEENKEKEKGETSLKIEKLDKFPEELNSLIKDVYKHFYMEYSINHAINLLKETKSVFAKDNYNDQKLNKKLLIFALSFMKKTKRKIKPIKYVKKIFYYSWI